MNSSTSFFARSKFYAEEYFPYGLARSGEFTCRQVELLEAHGKAYQAIHSGSQDPINDEERSFLSVCLGVKEPMTEHEKVWTTFRNKINSSPILVSFNRKNSSMLNFDRESELFARNRSI